MRNLAQFIRQIQETIEHLNNPEAEFESGRGHTNCIQISFLCTKCEKQFQTCHFGSAPANTRGYATCITDMFGGAACSVQTRKYFPTFAWLSGDAPQRLHAHIWDLALLGHQFNSRLHKTNFTQRQMRCQRHFPTTLEITFLVHN